MRSPVVIALVVGLGACLSGRGACAPRVLVTRTRGRRKRVLFTREARMRRVRGDIGASNDVRGARARQVVRGRVRG
jgi:hypothetical protein